MFSRTTIGFSITVAKKLTYQPMKPPDDSGTDPTWAILCGFPVILPVSKWDNATTHLHGLWQKRTGNPVSSERVLKNRSCSPLNMGVPLPCLLRET